MAKPCESNAPIAVGPRPSRSPITKRVALSRRVRKASSNDGHSRYGVAATAAVSSLADPAVVVPSETASARRFSRYGPE